MSPFSPKASRTKHNFSRDFIEYDEIKECLKGIARVIVFRSEISELYSGKIDGKSFGIMHMFEGHVTEGIMDGYARQLENNGECKIGFWKPITTDNVPAPFGKWAWYMKNGEFKVKEDIHLGAPDPALPYAIQIHKY